MFFKDFVSVKRQKIKRGASQTYDTPSCNRPTSAICSKTYPSFLTVKEGSTFLTKPLFPQGREDVTALRCSEPLRYKVVGSSKVYAILCGMGPPELFLIAVSLCACRHSNEEYCFILLLRGLPQGRCPSEAVCSKMELTSLVSAFFHP